MSKKEFRVVILAAGKSTRMPGRVPKLLLDFKGEPLITHALKAVKDSGIDKKPVIVVGHAAEVIKKVLGGRAEFVHQAEQLGTGHAVKTARKLLEGQTANIIVLYGDHPLIRASTIKELANYHLRKGSDLTVTTMEMPSSGELENYFNNFGRILRDSWGNFAGTREAADASQTEGAIREVNTGYYVFNARWLWENLDKISDENLQGEYYLTELDRIAVEHDARIATFKLEDPTEGIGINTPEQFEQAEKL